jgi:hypothetical protein
MRRGTSVATLTSSRETRFLAYAEFILSSAEGRRLGMTFKVVKLLTIHEYATSSICHSEELCDEESLSPLETQLLVTLASFDYGAVFRG